MSIYLYCQHCRQYNDVKSKKCSRCEESFPSVNRKYCVRAKMDGKLLIKFTHSLTLAREIEGALKGDMARGKYEIHVRRKLKTLDEVFKEYLTWAKENRKAWENNEKRYNQYLKPRFGKKPLDQISSFAVEKLRSDLKKMTNARKKPYATDTINQHVYLLRRLFNFAIERKWFTGPNPVSGVKLQKANNQIIRYLSDDEMERFLTVLKTWPCKESVEFVNFALLTGFRRSEILNMKWENIDLKNGFVYHPDPKGGEPVTVPVSDEALDVIRHRKQKEGFVFAGQEGGKRYDFKGPFLRILEKAKIKNFRFHDLRHNFASRLINRGVPLEQIQVLLSHKDPKTTKKYAHLDPKVLRETARASSNLIKEQMRKTDKRAAENE